MNATDNQNFLIQFIFIYTISFFLINYEVFVILIVLLCLETLFSKKNNELTIKKVEKVEKVSNKDKMENYLIGSHIAKRPTYLKTFENVEKNTKNINWKMNPVQMFTGSNKSWKVNIPSESDIEKTKIYMEENDINAFIHTSYLINLSRTGEKFIKARERLITDLKIGSMIGFNGVVVHVGKAVEN